MNYRAALKNCRPNGASAQVIGAVPVFIAALEAVETWFSTKPNEDDLRGYLGPSNAARAQAIRAVTNALSIVRAPDEAMFQPQMGGFVLTAEAQSRLALLANDLREHSEAIRRGIEQHGSYNVPWGVLSWGKDMSANGAEAIEKIIGTVCRQCDGRGIIDNPEAIYTQDRDTGYMETNDPEEVDCPHCDGTGLEPPKAAEPPVADEPTF